MDKIRVFESFAGYGSQSLALKRLGVPFEVVGISEVDKYAITAYGSVHSGIDYKNRVAKNVMLAELRAKKVGWDFQNDKCTLPTNVSKLTPIYNADRDSHNYGDISNIDWSIVPDFDLFTMSSPCQDFSLSGLRKGGVEGSGTRSSLLWECRRAIVAKKPKYILFENVKGLLAGEFKQGFMKWQSELANMGYSNYVKVLNSKDYGVPQSRERVFMVSILGDDWYNFPAPQPLTVRLRDVLDLEVDEKYYVSDEKIESIKNSTFVQNSKIIQEKDYCDTICARDYKDPKCVRIEQVGNIVTTGAWSQQGSAGSQRGRVYSTLGVAPTLSTMKGGGLEPKIVQIGRGYNKGGEKSISPTITTSSFECNNFVSDVRVRKLTPREGLRLMGVEDSDIDKMYDSGLSDSRLWHCAGNSIVVDVLVEIFRNMFIKSEVKETLFG